MRERVRARPETGSALLIFVKERDRERDRERD